jgi:hypothetical protein
LFSEKYVAEILFAGLFRGKLVGLGKFLLGVRIFYGFVSFSWMRMLLAVSF